MSFITSTTHICPTCKEKSYIEIEDNSTTLFCGIVGVSDLKNVIVNSGECICAFCRASIYKQK